MPQGKMSTYVIVLGVIGVALLSLAAGMAVMSTPPAAVARPAAAVVSYQNNTLWVQPNSAGVSQNLVHGQPTHIKRQGTHVDVQLDSGALVRMTPSTITLFAKNIADDVTLSDCTTTSNPPCQMSVPSGDGTERTTGVMLASNGTTSVLADMKQLPTGDAELSVKGSKLSLSLLGGRSHSFPIKKAFATGSAAFVLLDGPNNYALTAMITKTHMSLALPPKGSEFGSVEHISSCETSAAQMVTPCTHNTIMMGKTLTLTLASSNSALSELQAGAVPPSGWVLHPVSYMHVDSDTGLYVRMMLLVLQDATQLGLAYATYKNSTQVVVHQASDETADTIIQGFNFASTSPQRQTVNISPTAAAHFNVTIKSAVRAAVNVAPMRSWYEKAKNMKVAQDWLARQTWTASDTMTSTEVKASFKDACKVAGASQCLSDGTGTAVGGLDMDTTFAESASDQAQDRCEYYHCVAGCGADNCTEP